MSMQRVSIARWGIWGSLFGALFPVIGWAAATRGAIGIAEAHADQPVLWIVNLAPLVLALAALWIGYEHSKVVEALRITDQQVHERTAELRVRVGSDQEFYLAIGFEIETRARLWIKTLD